MYGQIVTVTLTRSCCVKFIPYGSFTWSVGIRLQYKCLLFKTVGRLLWDTNFADFMDFLDFYKICLTKLAEILLWHGLQTEEKCRFVKILSSNFLFSPFAKFIALKKDPLWYIVQTRIWSHETNCTLHMINIRMWYSITQQWRCNSILLGWIIIEASHATTIKYYIIMNSYAIM